MVERGEKKRGQRHAARRRDAGQQAARPVGQLPLQHLALDLQPHQQEEHGHQCVVDPVFEAERPDGGVKRAEIGG